MSPSLLPLHHLIELDDISNFDQDIPLVVDTTIIARFNLIHIEWAHFQIRNFTASHFSISSDNTEPRAILDLSRGHAHTHDHHGVIFSRIEYCLHEGCSEFQFIKPDIDHPRDNCFDFFEDVVDDLLVDEFDLRLREC